jgi:hypothetical protein
MMPFRTRAVNLRALISMIGPKANRSDNDSKRYDKPLDLCGTAGLYVRIESKLEPLTLKSHAYVASVALDFLIALARFLSRRVRYLHVRF